MELPIDHFRLLGIGPAGDTQTVLRTLALRLDRIPDQGFTTETLQVRARLLQDSADLLSDQTRRAAYERELTAVAAGDSAVPALEITSSQEVAGLLLLLEAGDAVGLSEFCDLVCGSDTALGRAICWLELVGPQQWFRWRQGDIQARPLTDLRPLRRERRRHQLLQERERQWQLLLRRRRPVDLEALPSPAPALQGQDRQGLVLMQSAPSTLAASGVTVLGQRPDYQLRFFAPGLGIEEDPVTGSAHALVAPWWMEQVGRPAVTGWQCSARRGGMLCEQATAGLVRLSGTGQVLWDGLITAGPSGSDADGWQVCRAA